VRAVPAFHPPRGSSFPRASIISLWSDPESQEEGSPVGHEVDTNRFVHGGRRGTEQIATTNNP